MRQLSKNRICDGFNPTTKSKANRTQMSFTRTTKLKVDVKFACRNVEHMTGKTTP